MFFCYFYKKYCLAAVPKPFFSVIMNFSGAYPEQGFLPKGAETLDFSALEGCEFYCSSEAASAIRTAIAPYGPEGIHWIDSGDYHYVSLFWLEKIREPFELLLFDHHSDDQAPSFGGEVLSCGSWVGEARGTLPLMKRDCWIDGASPLPSLEPSGLPLYLSIDKDILCRCSARTTWDQGELMLDGLLSAIACLCAGRRIIGADVCGEISFLKGGSRYDAAVNLETNTVLQDFLLNLRDQ